MSGSGRAPLREPLHGANTAARPEQAAPFLAQLKQTQRSLKHVQPASNAPKALSAQDQNTRPPADGRRATRGEHTPSVVPPAFASQMRAQAKAPGAEAPAARRGGDNASVPGRPPSAGGADATPSWKKRTAGTDFAAARRAFAGATSDESSVMSRSVSSRKEQGDGRPARLRLSRQSIASKAAAGDAAESRAGTAQWAKRGRDDVQAYEYLCHCSEAQQWMERVIGEPLGGDIANMGEEMRNGIALAKLAKAFEPACVPRIFVHPRLQYRHTDNINYFFQFVDKIRLPACFRFELTDVYEKKNFPKVVYCLHALSHFMAHHGRSDKVDDLVGKLHFDADQLEKTQRGIDAAPGALPSFAGVGQALAQEMGAGAAAGPRAKADDEWIARRTPAAPTEKNRAAEAALQREKLRAESERERRARDAEERERRARESEERLRARQAERERTAAETAREREQKRSAHLLELERKQREQAEARERERERRDGELERVRRELRAERERREALREEERERERARRAAERERLEKQREAERERALERERSLLERERDDFRARELARYERERAEQRARDAEEQRVREEEQERRLAAHEAELAEIRAARDAAVARAAQLAEEAARRDALDAERRAAERAEREAAEAERRAAEEAAAAERRSAAEAERVLAAAAPRLQAAVRGARARAAVHATRTALDASTPQVVALQSAVRGASARAAAAERRARADALRFGRVLVQVQAHARGVLLRRSFFRRFEAMEAAEGGVAALQAHLRGALSRRVLFGKLVRLETRVGAIVGVQSAARSLLAKRALLARVQQLRAAALSVCGLQAQVRGALARAAYARMSSAFERTEMVSSVSGMQSSLRAALWRRKHQELRKEMEFVKPDVTGIQATVRGLLVRQDYVWWRNHLHASEPVAVYLQSLVRGVLARRRFDASWGRILAHMPQIVGTQAVCRGRAVRTHYRALRAARNVPLDTIRVFAPLLGPTDAEFAEEREVEALRRHVVQAIRANQAVEAHVADLDIKIALLVKNQVGIEEVVKAKHERGLLGGRDTSVSAERQRNSVLAAAGDPFTEHALDRATTHRLELYQELFYLLQTRPEYLGRLLVQASASPAIASDDRRLFEQSILTLFGYAQQPREEYLLLRLLQFSIGEQLRTVGSLDEFVLHSAEFHRHVVHYSRGEVEREYLRQLLVPLVHQVVEDEALDLETDPVAIHEACGGAALPPSGGAGAEVHAALGDPRTRTVFIRHLQALRNTAEAFLEAFRSGAPMPFGMRFVAREMFRALQERFPDESLETLLHGVGYVVYFRYFHPAVVAPESFDVTNRILGALPRRNLAAVSQLLAQVALGRLFGEDVPHLQPLNEYVSQASARHTRWIQTLLDECPDAELHFGTDAYTDRAGLQKPSILISPNEVYAIHQLLCNNAPSLALAPQDPLRAILQELGAPPVSHSAELDRARDAEITLQLSTRLSTAPDAQQEEEEAHALFLETKRLVLSLLKVQGGRDLLDVFVSPVAEAHERVWSVVLAQACAQPGTKLGDVPTYSFSELKARTLENMLRLEQLGKMHRATHYQDMLDAIAADFLGKHRRATQRQAQRAMLTQTLQRLAEQRRFLEEQVRTYHSYVDRSMNAMQQRGSRKRFVLPFTSQYFHMRNLKAAGHVPQFGSYKFLASRLHDKGVLMAIENSNFTAMDQIHITISSDEIGQFTLEATVSNVSAGVCRFSMSDLLEAQYNKEVCVYLLDDTLKMNVDQFINLINRSTWPCARSGRLTRCRVLLVVASTARAPRGAHWPPHRRPDTHDTQIVVLLWNCTAHPTRPCAASRSPPRAGSRSAGSAAPRPAAPAPRAAPAATR